METRGSVGPSVRDRSKRARADSLFLFIFFRLCLEAHRALELLEDYHAKLTRPQDKQLRLAIERVIRIFKSRLFQALLGKSLLGFLSMLHSQQRRTLFVSGMNIAVVRPRLSRRIASPSAQGETRKI